ncbi:CAZyme family CE10 [Penicillium alfredii]|uniref:CAZyme family CE10 n=1 Tax=Penicillium alfredii TaxID=1506179 RepID=A0A9W9FA17_9EURO|nr:CAZyme family CE10 [Penicillium alfredii]KAJ5096368.1 CAZyme family CE10 [Penicillium alfredii]
MRFQGQPVLNALLFSSLTLAAPPTRKANPPDIASLGTIHVLHYNNLGPENNGSTAVLMHDRLSHKDATVKCAAIGERLLSWSPKATANRSELQHELDYLVFAKELQANDSIWVSTESSHSKDCHSFSPSRKGLVHASCNSKLPVLCTSSPPPTTDRDRKPRGSTKLMVQSSGYTLTGYRDARSFRFMGIPFANPPINELRFAPPQAYSGPKVIDATSMGDSCIQSLSSFGTLDNGGISEDCLYLNVYTPILPSWTNTNTTRRPVAVYLYGGAFLEGSAAMVDYDGGNFASRSDVVIVTLNYRVGALGYLSTGNLTTGSYGTRDQIMALHWVQKHIAAFGGDPSHVTVFGQSAGGQSTVALLSSTAAKGLFSGALVQSAPLDLPWFPRGLYSKYIAPEVGKAVGCDKHSSEKELLKCLRSAPAHKYLDNSTDFKTATSNIASNIAHHYYHNTKLLSATEPLMPMVDDSDSGVIDDQFHTLLEHNKLPIHVPTMFTTMRDEAGLYIGKQIPDLGSSQIALDTVFETSFGSKLAGHMIASKAFAVNHSDPDGVRNAAADAVTHAEWTCAQGYLLNHSGTAFPSVYEAVISNGHIQTTVDVPAICSPNNDYNASCHASDVLLAWGTLNAKTKNVAPYYGPGDIRHAQILHDVFASFFRSRTPNPDPEYLRVRGPAYASTLAVFGTSDQLQARGSSSAQHEYTIEPYHASDRNISLLGMPPSRTTNFADSGKCAVFRDYGFTFQRAHLSD